MGQIPKISAGYQDTLATGMSASAPTFTLASGRDVAGNLLSGLYGLTVDSEWMLATISAGVGTVVVRGCDPSNPLTSVPALQASHRKGAVVMLTDYAFLGYVWQLLTGNLTFDNLLQYTSYLLPTLRAHLAPKGYVDDVMSGATPTASNVNAGTLKTDQAPNSLPRALNVYVQQQAAPGMALAVLPLALDTLDQQVSFAGGSSPTFASPSLQITYSIPNNPTNGSTWSMTVNGTLISGAFVTAIGSTPGNVLIQGSAAATVAALLNLLQNPGTTNANQVALSGPNQVLAAYCGYTSPTSTTLQCQGLNGMAITSLTGATSATGATVTANVNPRIDLLVYSTSATALATRQGTAAASPAAPSPLTGDIVLAQIYHRAGEASIKDNDDSANGYILRWLTPSLYEPDALRGASPLTYVATTGSANAFVATLSPAPAAINQGTTLRLKASFAVTGDATLNVNGLTPSAHIYKSGSTALAANDISTGQVFTVVFDGTNWQLQSPTASTIPPQALSSMAATNISGTGYGGVSPVLAPYGSYGAYPCYEANNAEAFAPLYNFSGILLDTLANAIGFGTIAGMVPANQSTRPSNGAKFYATVNFSPAASYCFGNASGVFTGTYYVSGSYSSAVTFVGAPSPQSGFAMAPLAFTDGTYIYLPMQFSAGYNFAKFSVSGATLTYVSTVNFASLSTAAGTYSDGTYLYGSNNTTLAKWALTGGSAVATYPGLQSPTGYVFALSATLLGIMNLNQAMVGSSSPTAITTVSVSSIPKF